MDATTAKKIADEYRARGAETKEQFCARKQISAGALRSCIEKPRGVALKKSLKISKRASKPQKPPAALKGATITKSDGAVDVTGYTTVRAVFTAPVIEASAAARPEKVEVRPEKEAWVKPELVRLTAFDVESMALEESTVLGETDVEGILKGYLDRMEAVKKENASLRRDLIAALSKYERLLALLKRLKEAAA